MELRNADGLTEEEFLQQYRPGDYERPAVTVDMLIFSVNQRKDRLKLLLIRRKNHPFMNCWALPGGFLDITESAYSAAARELKEETGLEGIYMEQLYTFTRPDRDPRMRVISIAYMALIPEPLLVKAGDDAADAAWFELSWSDTLLTLFHPEKNLKIEYALEKKLFLNGRLKAEGMKAECVSEEKLAFDHMEEIITAWERLRNKAEYSRILFGLLPEEFTVPEMISVYQAVLQREIHRGNFMRKAKSWLEDTGKLADSCTKKAVLYRLKEDVYV